MDRATFVIPAFAGMTEIIPSPILPWKEERVRAMA
jgi:hypothetical protein